MAGYGYEGLSEQNFVGFHAELTSGPWAAMKALVGAAQSGRLVLGDGAERGWVAELARRLYGPRGPVVA